MKQFVVVGVGRFGSALLENLAQSSQQVLVIDSDEKMIQSINDNRLATYAVVADATNENVMRSLICSKDRSKCEYDVGIVCIGENIEASILVTVLMKEIGVKKVVAKVTSDLHGKVLEKILSTAPKGEDEIIYPYKDIAELVATRLVRPNIQEEVNLSADYKFIRVSPPKKIVGKSLVDLNLRKAYDINIIGIKSAKSEAVDFNVKPGRVLETGDTILAVIPNVMIDKFLKET
jgi:trk system potassium uptake protein TrkA